MDWFYGIMVVNKMDTEVIIRMEREVGVLR